MREMQKIQNKNGFTTIEIIISLIFSAIAAMMMLLFFQKSNVFHRSILQDLERNLEIVRIQHLIRPHSVQTIHWADQENLIIKYNANLRDTIHVSIKQQTIYRNGKKIKFNHLHPLGFALQENKEYFLKLNCKEKELSWIIERTPF